MRIDIHAEISISFSVTVDDKEVYILTLKGGTWELSHYPNGWWNIGQGRIGWTEALKRSLNTIEQWERRVASA
jgi:hypothetical protein